MDETGGPIGNADGNNPEPRRPETFWGEAFEGIEVRDRYGDYS
jgi:hypothetical protein